MISQLQIHSNLSPLQIKLRTFLANGNCELMGIPFIHRCSRTPVLSLRWWHIFLILPLSRLPHISSWYIPLVLLVLSQACEFVKLFQTDFSKVGVALRKLSGHSNLLSHKVKVNIPLHHTFTSYLYVSFWMRLVLVAVCIIVLCFCGIFVILFCLFMFKRQRNRAYDTKVYDIY